MNYGMSSPTHILAYTSYFLLLIVGNMSSVFPMSSLCEAVILFVGYQDIALKVFGAAALHPVLSSSQVLWVGVDAWTGLELQDTTLLPIGTIGITPQVAQTPVTEDYVRRWAALPPDEYPSLHQQGGGSRQVLATYSSTLVDATVALGIALQHAVDKRLGKCINE